MEKIRAVYPGSFDPVTLGHVDLIVRGARIFNELIVAVGENPRKKSLFSARERVDFIKDAIPRGLNVRVTSFSTLLVDFAIKEKAHVILKGLRAVSDFDYELQMSLINRRMAGALETVFMMPSEEFSFVSSSLLKEIAAYGGDISSMVTPAVERALKAKLSAVGPRKNRSKRK